jgi:hypothetical protein
MKRTLIIQLLLCMATTSSFAQFAGQLGLSSADVAFTGEGAGDMAGWHISVAGDVNNDGYSDILIGAPYNDNSSRIDNGKVYLILGKSLGWKSPMNLSEANATFLGEESNNQASNDVFELGDVNNDNIDDFAIGVKKINQGGTSAGKVYIFFGKSFGWHVGTPLAEADVTILGEGNTSESGHVFPLGDVNGDGFNDILIGGGFNDEAGLNAGKVYVYFGKPTAAWVKTDTISNADASFLGEQPGDQAGHRIAGVGDVNGDGLGDFIVGANGRDQDGLLNRGIAYLILGKTSGWGQNVSLANADASFLGPKIAKMEIGYNVTGPGDVNGDGLDDMLIAGGGKSKVYLILGKSSGWVKNQPIETAATTIFSGESEVDFAGGDMRTLGDINDDDYADFIIGAFGNDQNGKDAGKAYLYYGRPDWQYEMNLASADASFLGEHPGDFAGFSVAGGGDIDNDGTDDVLVSSAQNDDSAPDAGKVYLFFSRIKPFVLTSPNGGETWDVGSTEKFHWNSKNPQGNIKIELSRNGGSVWEVLMTVPDTGSATWTVTGPATSQCIVRMTQLATGETDMSNNMFRLVDASLIVQSPNGNEEWYIGEQKNITWTGTGAFPMVKIEYSSDNGATWTIVQDSTLNDGQYDWLVPSVESTQCLVRIKDARDGLPADVSDAVFKIAIPPTSVLVTSPNGGESWPVGSVKNITWISFSTSGTVKIELSRNNGSSWEIIAASVPDNHVFPWTVTEPGSQVCLVKISDAVTGESDQSNGIFAITTANAVIQLLAPNGGEKLQIGSSYEIKWSSANGSGNVRIDLSRNNGGTWEVIKNSTSDDGSHMWAVSGPAANKCLVRVRDVLGGSSDVSDAVFSISGTQPMSVIAPNGGEDWPVNTQQQIMWNIIDRESVVNVYLSRDNGVNWEFLTSQPDSGLYKWTVTGPVSQNCMVLISHLGGNPFDMSDASFRITEAPSITVTSPVGGETWQIDSVHDITWNYVKTSGAVNIYISRDNGAAWEEIEKWTQNDGRTTWKVTGPASAQCLIRIRDNAGPAAGVSLSTFNITAVPTLTLSSPNGGEKWYVTTEHQITWNSTNDAGDINIYISRDNESTWEFLASVADIGHFAWTVTGPASDSCKVLVSNTAGTLFDTSDGLFQITEEVVIPQVTVLYPNGDETWVIGQDRDIRWATENAGDSVKIEISRDEGQNWEVIQRSTYNDSTCTWTVTGPASEKCLVRVSTLDGNGSDTSDALFTIQGQPVISVTKPVRGELWLIDTVYEIAWTSQSVNSNVMVELSRNNGQTWEMLDENTENDGSFFWKVLEPEASKCIVRISDIYRTVSATSDSLFTIRLESKIPYSAAEVKTFALYPNFPNPFNPSTHIVFQCPKQAHVVIEIYNVTGSLVRRLVDDVYDRGVHAVQWDGRLQQGGVAPSGIYFFKLSADNFHQTGQMLLLK